MTTRLRALNEPVGSWWAAFDNGEVWPVEVLSANMFGTRVRATHDAAPEGEHLLHPSRVHDSDFNRPKWGVLMAYIVRKTAKPPEWVVIDTSEIVWHGGGTGTHDDAHERAEELAEARRTAQLWERDARP